MRGDTGRPPSKPASRLNPLAPFRLNGVGRNTSATLPSCSPCPTDGSCWELSIGPARSMKLY
ncbi:hypothetical protein MHYP_G00135980 [Metynnis hypsauchen]